MNNRVGEIKVGPLEYQIKIQERAIGYFGVKAESLSKSLDQNYESVKAEK
jgi:hypothetical protein